MESFVTKALGELQKHRQIAPHQRAVCEGSLSFDTHGTSDSVSWLLAGCRYGGPYKREWHPDSVAC